jgi:hypothetical protein
MRARIEVRFPGYAKVNDFVRCIAWCAANARDGAATALTRTEIVPATLRCVHDTSHATACV